jgi:hypothetical protein
VVQPDDEMLTAYAQLRADCRRAGHALGDKTHDGDRWTLPEHPRAAARYGRRTLTQLSCSLWAVVVVLLLDPG